MWVHPKVFPKMKMLSWFTHPQPIPNQYDFLPFVFHISMTNQYDFLPFVLCSHSVFFFFCRLKFKMLFTYNLKNHLDHFHEIFMSELILWVWSFQSISWVISQNFAWIKQCVQITKWCFWNIKSSHLLHCIKLSSDVFQRRNKCIQVC